MFYEGHVALTLFCLAIITITVTSAIFNKYILCYFSFPREMQTSSCMAIVFICCFAVSYNI